MIAAPTRTPSPEPHLAQVAWSVRDLARTCRFYVEVIGFVRAGGRLLWGPGLSVLQELGDDAEATVWWALGGQRFVQLEFFHHTRPVGRARSSASGPRDLGWSRVAIGVPDLAVVLRRAKDAGHLPLGPVQTDAGVARVALRDPDGVVVELIGDGGQREALDGAADGQGGSGRVGVARPALRSVALSVADLARASHFWIETCGLVERAADTLHCPDHEALWGLPGARCERRVARGVDVALELVQYVDPPGRARARDARLSDQGLLNVALAFRDRARFDALHERLLAAGYRATVACPAGPFASTYLRDGEGNSCEIFACPEDHDALLGFVAEGGFSPGTRLDP